MSTQSYYRALSETLRREEPVTQVTVIAAPSNSATALGRKMLVWPDGKSQGGFGSAAMDRAAIALAQEAQASGPIDAVLDAVELELFVEVFAPPAKLVIVGAVHVAIHLIHFAQRLGFHCIVVDAREAFATRERFPHADQLIVGWPAEILAEMPIHDSAFCVFLTHDPKLDDPAIRVALQRGAGYVGALGSKRTHRKRVESLRELGLEDAEIQKIHAPIGLDLGGRKPEEIALAIAAQLVQKRYGKA